MEAKNLEEYMLRYGPVLGEQITTLAKPLHTPVVDDTNVCRTDKKPFDGQSHVITSMVRQLNRDKSGIIAATMGTGKSLMGAVAIHTHANGKPYRAIIMCPPHLVEKWKREIETTLPGATASIATKYKDVAHLRNRVKPDHAEWWIVSQTTAKLGQPWKPVFKTLTPAQAKSNLYHRVKGMTPPHIGNVFCTCCGNGVTKTTSTNTVHLEAEDLEKARTDCESCGEPLWQWENKFDRWPVADFIARMGRGIISYTILDEFHEMKSPDTEIGLAMHKLVNASRKVLALTGTLLGGYADHMRSLLWRLNPAPLVAEGMKFDQATEFTERYGRLEYIISEKGNGKHESTRMARGKKITGKTQKKIKPGIMPSLFINHLMRMCVFLELDELTDALPPLEQEVITVPLDPMIRDEYRRLETALRNQVKLMMARGDFRLLGAMLSSLLGYPDLPTGWGEIGYWDHDKAGNKQWITVYKTTDMPIEGHIFPKEKALVDAVLQEKSEGRQTWVYTTMTDKHDTCERLKSLLEARGLSVTILRAKVKPRDREEWIFKHAKGMDVIISHPELVKTGLDLFAKCGNHNFATLIFYQTGYNLFTLRQAAGRARRIGQRLLCRVKFLAYEGTMQTTALALMGDKLTAAQAVEGSFSEEGLAAMAGEDGSIEMAMAKSIAASIECDAQRSWSKLTAHNPKPAVEPVASVAQPIILPPMQTEQINPKPESIIVRKQLALF